MKKENKNTGCAGFCAGKVIQKTKTKPQFQKVTDSSCRPIRGLWKRGKRFYARVSLTDENGSIIDRRIPLKAKSIPEARLEYALVKSNLIHSATDHDILSFSSFAQKCLYEIDGLKRPRTVELEELHLKHLKQFLGNLKLNKISKQHVVRFRTAKIKGGWTGRTANLSITILNNLLNHAKDNGLINTLPTADLKPIRWKPKKRPLFAPEQIEAICDAALQNCKHGQLLADYVQLMKTCGSRASETLRLKWSDLDWDRKQLIIGSDGLTKNHESRVVDFNPALESHLLEMHKRRNGSAYLFPSPKLATTDNPTKTLKGVHHKARDIAGVEGFGFHDCRHYFISHAVMSGIDYMTIARWVGHKDGGVLIGRVYGHLNDEHARRAARKLKLE